MLSGIGNFVFDCHIKSTSNSSVFANVRNKDVLSGTSTTCKNKPFFLVKTALFSPQET